MEVINVAEVKAERQTFTIVFAGRRQDKFVYYEVHDNTLGNRKNGS